MFNKLSENISGVFQKLSGRGVIREEDINLAMREVRIALLEADVSLEVAKDFIEKVKAKALGEEVVKSVKPAQMVIKIVQDELTEFLGGESPEPLNLKTTPPAIILMAGLQGSGKTTTSGKLANFLAKKQNKKTLLASLDIYRPAAQKQLEILATQIGGNSLPIIDRQTPEQITKRAIEAAKLGAYDVLILDTAGRLHIDDELMDELAKVKAIANPIETILVADSITGQDAVNVAKQFNEKIGLTGIILTRIDGDGRGGAALSMKAVTGCPIKFLGVGEKIDEFEPFHAERIAGRILDKGDIISLVERAQESINKEDAEKMMQKMQKGKFDMNDLASQIKTIKKMGGIGGFASMLPGMGKLKAAMGDAKIDEDILNQQLAIIGSMTVKERANPDTINGSRRKRIASGSGTSVPEVNKILKQYKQMQTAMKKFGGMGAGGMKNFSKMQSLMSKLKG
jgi:signal recognition particle subunit SRP54